ncbi:ATP-grasp domain-containing protein, partial [Candidatus Gracilibacteria bacterium]|nr:ATP-grasp domain-containing protein [Candidatus Gracilibacteria bacterium]
MTNQPRVLLLTTASSYRAMAFVSAAQRLDVKALVAIDTPTALVRERNDCIELDFAREKAALAAITALHAHMPLAAIIAVDDSGGLLAARASARFGLPHNDPQAAEAARDKYLMRTLFARAGVASPPFRLCSTDDDLPQLAQQINYPCVVKPLRLNGSRGVIRADDEAQFVAAAQRLGRLLRKIDGDGPQPFLVEDFIPGFEVALEGLIDNGRLQLLALFDKPDPLDGPFFEETIYVTPSRLPDDVQQAIVATAAAAAQAVGLRTG